MQIIMTEEPEHGLIAVFCPEYAESGTSGVQT